MPPLTTREVLVEALQTHQPTETEFGPLYCHHCSESIGEWVQWTPDHVAAALAAALSAQSERAEVERVHNHPPCRPVCNERLVGGRLRGTCLNDDGSERAEVKG